MVELLVPSLASNPSSLIPSTIEVVNYEVPLGKSDHVVLTWTLLLAIPPVPNNQVKHNYP